MIKSEVAKLLCQIAEQQEPPLDYVLDLAISTTPKLKSVASPQLLESIAKNPLIRYMTTSYLLQDRKNSCLDMGYDQLFNLLYQRLAEVYFQEKIRIAAQELPYPIELIDISDGTKAGNYLYRKNTFGNTVVIDKKTGDFVTDIDGLVAIGENEGAFNYCRRWQPFIIEVKMATFGHCRGSEEVDRYFNKLTRVIKMPDSLKAIAPVLEYFQELYMLGEIENNPCDVGIIVGMPPDRVNIIRIGSQRSFVGRGGNIIKFHKHFKEYYQMVYSVAERFKINMA